MTEQTSHFLSIDIGGTFIKHALINRSGHIISVKKETTPKNLADFKACLKVVLEAYRGTIRAVAVSCPGKIDSQAGVVYHGGALLYLHEFHLKEFIETYLGLPCEMMNDGKAAAMAEVWLGQLKGIQNGGVMTLGTGVGGGLILNGTLHSGSHFQAGELSFMFLSTTLPVEMTSMAGSRGSAVLFIQAAAKLLGLTDPLDGKTVFEELEKHNPLIYPIFQEFCQRIAFIIMNVQAVVDLERIAIGGGISAQSLLIEEIKNQYHTILESFPMLAAIITPADIVPCHFRNEAGLLGALYHLLEEQDRK